MSVETKDFSPLTSPDYFAMAIVNPQKRLVNDLKGIYDQVFQSSSRTSVLFDLVAKIDHLVKSFNLQELDPCYQKRIDDMCKFLVTRLNMRESQYLQSLIRWQEEESKCLNEEIVKKIYPLEWEGMCSFIRQSVSHILRTGSPGGKSVGLPYTTSLGRSVIVSYRYRQKKAQILVYENVRETRFKLIQRVVLATGPMIKGVSDFIFSRAKVRSQLRKDTIVQTMVRHEEEVSRCMHKAGVQDVIHYNFSSPKRKGTTLVYPFCKQDVKSLLDQLPQGPDSPQKVSFLLKNIALPVARALCDLHRNRIVHLDLRPENVEISERDCACLGGLGSSKIMLSSEDGPFSSPYLTAPEIFEQSEMWKASPALDMWAFGLFLTDLFLGPTRNYLRSEWPEDCVELSSGQQQALIRMLSERIKEEFKRCALSCSSPVPGRLAKLVEGLLNPDPRTRFTDRFVLQELEAISEAWSALY